MNRMERAVPLSQQAYEQIKDKIVTLELRPGAVIDETELQEELRLGRTPIREALKRLALENLVTIVPRRGMFVTDIGINDLQRLLEVRIMLEKLAAQLAAQRGTSKHWDQMEQLLAGAQETDGDNEALIEADEAFHELIYLAADNRFLRDTLTVLLSLNERLWYFFLPEIGSMHGAINEHLAILDSLKRRDSKAAAALMEQHISSLQEKIQAVMTAPPISEADTNE